MELSEQFKYYTNGELSTFKQCKRRWYLNNYRKLGPKNEKLTGPLALGTKIHAALAEFYGHGVDPLSSLEEYAQRDYAKLEDNEWITQNQKDLDEDTKLARIMIEGYLEWLEDEAADYGIRVIAPEEPVIANPKMEDFPNVRLLGKLDVRAERIRDGSRIFIDHKTCQTFESVEKMAILNEQFLQYHLLELLKLVEEGLTADHRTDGAVINMLRKVKRTAKAKPPFYKRLEVRHNLNTLTSYWRRVVETIRQIEYTRARLDAGENPVMVAYPTPSESCPWKCEYYRVCSMFDDGSRVEDYLSANYVTINPLQRYEPESVGVTN